VRSHRQSVKLSIREGELEEQGALVLHSQEWLCHLRRATGTTSPRIKMRRHGTCTESHAQHRRMGHPQIQQQTEARGESGGREKRRGIPRSTTPTHAKPACLGDPGFARNDNARAGRRALGYRAKGLRSSFWRAVCVFARRATHIVGRPNLMCALRDRVAWSQCLKVEPESRRGNGDCKS
jgi:hypothetical protein